MMRRFCWAALIVSLWASVVYADKYIRDGASGSTCADWGSNACDDFPSYSSDTTYWVADGTYANAGWINATNVVIKKAVVAGTVTAEYPAGMTAAEAHGTSTGWSDAYGDGQATLGSLIILTTGVVVNGQKRDETDWDSGSAYGFRITEINGSAGEVRGDSVTIKYCEIGGAYSLVYDPSIPSAGFYCLQGGSGELCDDWLIARNYIHNVGIVGQMAGVDSWVWEYNWAGLNWSKEIIRGQNTSTNVVMRYNFFKDGCLADCTADIALFPNVGSEPASDGFYFYGNVIWKSYATNPNSNAMVVNEASNNSNAIYNNTFVSYGTNQGVLALNNYGAIRNNIVYYPNGMVYGCQAVTCDNNSVYTDSVPPLVSIAGGNFRLTEALAGVSLGSTYNADMDGVTRGSDGVWDRGAYEYNVGGVGTISNITIGPGVSLR